MEEDLTVEMIAEQIMGWRKGKGGGAIFPARYGQDSRYWYGVDGGQQRACITDVFANLHAWNPLIKIADTWQVVEAMRRRGFRMMLCDVPGGTGKLARYDYDAEGYAQSAERATDQEAICRAAYRALAVKR